MNINAKGAGSVDDTPPKLLGKHPNKLKRPLTANNIQRKAFTFVELLVVIVIFCVIGLFIVPFFAQIPFFLAFGWIWGLCRFFIGLGHEPMAIGIALVALLFLPLGFHLFAALFAKRRKMIWSFRQSCLTSLCTVLMAVTGIAIISGFHETVWFFYPKEPIIDSGRKVIYRMISVNNLKQFGYGVHYYHDTYKLMPSGGTVLEDGQLGHGWMTQLLPFCEQKRVYEKIDLTKPWCDPQNAPVFKERLKQPFESPYFTQLPEEERYDLNGFAKTDYAGNQFVLPVGRSLKFDEITNGLSNTILIGEVTQNLSAWGSPLNSRDPRLGINRSPYGFGSKHVGGINSFTATVTLIFILKQLIRKSLKPLQNQTISPLRAKWSNRFFRQPLSIMPQLDAISFFFVLFLAATVLLTLVFRYGFSPSLTIGDGLRFGLFWAIFVTVVLVMNQAARETLQPGRWVNEKLFVPTVHGEVLGVDEPVKNLFLGWLLFPMRTFPHAKIDTEAILTGIAVFFAAGIVLEFFGRKLAPHWRSRRTPAILAGFLLLDLMTYSAVGIVRQVGWIFCGG